MRMRVFGRGCHAVCAAFLVCAYSAIARGDNSPFGDWRTQQPEAVEARHVSRETVDDESSNHPTNFQRKLIPIKEPIVDKNFAIFARPLEPDAEMLPAHYTGVKPPGVDHMELRYAESQVSKAVPMLEPSKKQAASTRRMAKKEESKNDSDEQGHRKSSSFEKLQKGEHLKKKKKSQYNETGGNTNAQGNREYNSGHEAEHDGGGGAADHRTKSNGHVDRKATGYRNVYHKDEYKKDHDFYDNDDHGGHSKKHGRYNEKHVAVEGTFKMGGTRNSGSDEVELDKQGVNGSSRTEGESKGHEARRGHDGYFKSFQGFAKQAAKNEGRKFGFGQTKAR